MAYVRHKIFLLFLGELPRSGIPNHLTDNLMNGNNGDISAERRSSGVHQITAKPQIRVVTPPRYSPKSIQQLQPISQQSPSTSLPYSSQLSSLNSNNSHHPITAQTGGLIDPHSIPVSLQHHYTTTTLQQQSQTSFPQSQHPVPLTHLHCSTPSLYPPVSKLFFFLLSYY